MPTKDQYNEVLILSLTGIIVFLVLSGLMVFIMLFYQKKKFQHRTQLADMGKKYSEELLRSQIELQEQTFNAISQEIHDNVGQVLSLAKVQLNIIESSDVIDRSFISEAKGNIGKAMTDLRDIAHSLSTERIRCLSLAELVNEELERINRTGIVRTSVQTSGVESDFDEKKKLIVFRMVQESLQNMIKHSGADEVKVSFFFCPASSRVEILDNGMGFDTSVVMGKSVGLGLKNITDRAEIIGGNASINSIINQGTCIIITIPHAQ